jgi:ketosteroid isomerase-like protein
MKNLAAFVLVLALVTTVTAPAYAQSADETAVLRQIDALSKAITTVDKAQLENLVWPELTYGHSAGRIETRAQFVDNLVTKKSIVSKIELSKMTTSMVGDIAMVRCHFGGITESTGKPVQLDVHVLMIWQKRGGEWKLLARQAFKL